MSRQPVIPPEDPKYPAVRARMVALWLRTLFGYLMMGGLIFLALWAFNFSFTLQLSWSLLWLALPFVMLFLGPYLARVLMKATPADPTNPTHARAQRLLDEAVAESGVKFHPPLFASPNPMPNAACTGPYPGRSIVIFTEGLFLCGMTDNEIKAVFKHELSHARNFDMLVNTIVVFMSSVLNMILNQGLNLLLTAWGWIKRLLGFKATARVLPPIITNVLFYAIFWLVGQVTKIIQMFVTRSRESLADASACYLGANPCDLGMALEKLVAYVMKHRPKASLTQAFTTQQDLLPVLQDVSVWLALRSITTVDVVNDTLVEEPQPKGIWEWLKSVWRYLQLSHPPVPQRLKDLDHMNGSSCPRLPDDQ